jgi:hypothetical protein
MRAGKPKGQETPKKIQKNPPQVGTGASSNWKASKWEDEGGGFGEFFFQIARFL